MVYTEEDIIMKKDRQPQPRREPISMNIDSELWREVRKMAIDKGITATEYFEQALREKLAKESK
jgi:hypothetical protein